MPYADVGKLLIWACYWLRAGLRTGESATGLSHPFLGRTCCDPRVEGRIERSVRIRGCNAKETGFPLSGALKSFKFEDLSLLEDRLNVPTSRSKSCGTSTSTDPATQSQRVIDSGLGLERDLSS